MIKKHFKIKHKCRNVTHKAWLKCSFWRRSFEILLTVSVISNWKWPWKAIRDNVQLLISPTTSGDGGDSPFWGIFQSMGMPLHFMLNWNRSQYKWKEIGVNTFPLLDGASNKYRVNGKFSFMQMIQCFTTITWLWGVILCFYFTDSGTLAGKPQLNSQRCVRPCCWFARCCVSRTRWAPGAHEEARTPAPQAHRQPPPHHWVPAGNRPSGLKWEQRNLISFGSPPEQWCRQMTILFKTNAIFLAYHLSHVFFLHENKLIEGGKKELLCFLCWNHHKCPC